MLTKQWQISAIVVVCALTALGCRSMTGRSFGQQWEDKTITTQVKSMLTAESFGNVFSTDVGTHYGVVYLGGIVATPEARAEAERIASRVKGVKGVVNNIAVVPHASRVSGALPGPSPEASTGSTSGARR